MEDEDDEDSEIDGVRGGGRGGGGAGGGGGVARYLARSNAHLGYPLTARASLMRSISACLSSSLDGIRAARRVSEWMVESLCASGWWLSKEMY